MGRLGAAGGLEMVAHPLWRGTVHPGLQFKAYRPGCSWRTSLCSFS